MYNHSATVVVWDTARFGMNPIPSKHWSSNTNIDTHTDIGTLGGKGGVHKQLAKPQQPILN